MTIDAEAPDSLDVDGIAITRLALSAKDNPELAERYLGTAASAVYLMRPDQHVAARWAAFDESAVRKALKTATAQG
jgi:3-(3-hydroxy-phenyl)propionate hydroxylase